MVRSQNCSAAVFGTNLTETRPSSRTGLFINTQSAASCSGILTLWHYCFYNENAGSEGITRFAIYRKKKNNNKSDNRYDRVYSEGKISESIPSSPSFSCKSLTPSETNIQVEPGDIILACIHNNNSLDVLAESASEYEVYAKGGCEEDKKIPNFISLSDYELISNSAVHVFAGE